MKKRFLAFFVLTAVTVAGNTSAVWAQGDTGSAPSVTATPQKTTGHGKKETPKKAAKVQAEPSQPLAVSDKGTTLNGPMTITGKDLKLFVNQAFIPPKAKITSWQMGSPGKEGTAPAVKADSGKKTKDAASSPPKASGTPAAATKPASTSGTTTATGPIDFQGPVTIYSGAWIISASEVIVPKAETSASGTGDESAKEAATAQPTPDYATQHFFIELGYVSFAPYALNAPASLSGNYTLTTNSQISSLVSISTRFRDVKPWDLANPNNHENVDQKLGDISMLNFGLSVAGSSPISIQANTAINAGNMYGELYESLDFIPLKFSNYKDHLNADKTALVDPATLPYLWDLGVYYGFNSNRSDLNLSQQLGFGPIGAVGIPNGKGLPIELVGGLMPGLVYFPRFVDHTLSEISTRNGYPLFNGQFSFLIFISCNLPVGGNYITVDAETANSFDTSFNTWSVSLGYTVPLTKLWTDLFGK